VPHLRQLMLEELRRRSFVLSQVSKSRPLAPMFKFSVTKSRGHGTRTVAAELTND
jgi:hypothetical protein